MRTILTLFILATCTSALAESSGNAAAMPSEPPRWFFAEIEGPLTLAQEGVFAFDAIYSRGYGWVGDGEPSMAITVTDAAGEAVAGEATYHERWADMVGTVIWRASTGGLEAGASFSAHIELHSAPDTAGFGVDDIIRDVDLVVAPEMTQAAVAAEVTDHVPGDLAPYPPVDHSCYLPVTSLTYQEPAATPDWMADFLRYDIHSLSPDDATANMVAALEDPGTVAVSHGVLGDTYCTRVTTWNLVDDTEETVEDCLDAEALADTLEEGQVMCTNENLANPSVGTGETDSSGCGAAPTALPLWLLAIGFIFVNRQQLASFSGGP